MQQCTAGARRAGYDRTAGCRGLAVVITGVRQSWTFDLRNQCMSEITANDAVDESAKCSFATADVEAAVVPRLNCPRRPIWQDFVG